MVFIFYQVPALLFQAFLLAHLFCRHSAVVIFTVGTAVIRITVIPSLFHHDVPYPRASPFISYTLDLFLLGLYWMQEGLAYIRAYYILKDVCHKIGPVI